MVSAGGRMPLIDADFLPQHMRRPQPWAFLFPLPSPVTPSALCQHTSILQTMGVLLSPGPHWQIPRSARPGRLQLIGREQPGLAIRGTRAPPRAPSLLGVVSQSSHVLLACGCPTAFTPLDNSPQCLSPPFKLEALSSY